jgi:hypothetical protein
MEDCDGVPLDHPVETSALIYFMQEDRPTKYTICMEKNWNLISIPVKPHITEDPLDPVPQIAKLLEPIRPSLFEVWTYEGGEWLRFMYDDPTSDLFLMKDGQGYFVRMLWPDCLDGQGSDHCTTGGIGELPPMYPVDEGWNLIGATICDCNEDGVVDNDDVKGDCCYEPLPCMECVPDCWDWELSIDKYLASMNVGLGGLDPRYVYGDEARVVRWWEPWMGYDPKDPDLAAGAKWHSLERCDTLWVGRGYWMYSSLPDLTIIPPVPGGDCVR